MIFLGSSSVKDIIIQKDRELLSLCFIYRQNYYYIVPIFCHVITQRKDQFLNKNKYIAGTKNYENLWSYGYIVNLFLLWFSILYFIILINDA